MKEFIDRMAPICNYIIVCVYVQNESLVRTVCVENVPWPCGRGSQPLSWEQGSFHTTFLV